MQDQGFVAIYRWRVAPEHEAAFRTHWQAITRAALVKGSHGSLLARSDDGLLVGIALWPSREARDAAFARIAKNGDWPPSERISEERLSVLDDLWRVSPFK